MDNKIMKFGYEDTDKKIEIDLYGLVFEIKNLSNEKIENFRNFDKNLSNVQEKQPAYIALEKHAKRSAVKRIEKHVSDVGMKCT